MPTEMVFFYSSLSLFLSLFEFSIVSVVGRQQMNRAKGKKSQILNLRAKLLALNAIILNNFNVRLVIRSGANSWSC